MVRLERIWEVVGTYSFAKTPLKAAQAPLVTAKKSQADFGFGVDMMGGCVLGFAGQWCGVEVAVGRCAATAGTGPPRAWPSLELS